MKDATTQPGQLWPRQAGNESGAPQRCALVIAWSFGEPGRVGEVALLAPDQVFTLGRGDARPDDEGSRLRFLRQGPGTLAATPDLQSPGLSRRQLVLRADREGLQVECVGRCPMRINSTAVTTGRVRPGDTLLIGQELLLQCELRPAQIPARQLQAHVFGGPDADGIVGESVEAWELREAARFAASSGGHALILGPSGTGKELVARAIHRASRPAGPFVARNAATLPDGLIDAELFGNAANFPNPGMAERSGLLGRANGGTLFLDEIAELGESLQAHLLRVMDTGGEYQRLGDPESRGTDARFVAATNRSGEELKHDLRARFVVTVEVPPLDARRADIPLILRSLLDGAADKQPDLRDRFSEAGHWRIDPGLIEGLLQHRFTHHVRELEQLMWLSLRDSREDYLTTVDEIRARLTAPPPGPPPGPVGPDEIRAALDAEGGSITRAATRLGLPSRYALYRLMQKHGVSRS